MKKTSSEKKLNSFFWQTTLTIFLSLLLNLGFFYGINILDLQIRIFNENVSPILTLSILLIMSVGVAVIISFLLARLLTKSTSELKTATAEIAKGNFDIKLEKRKNQMLNELIDDFNAMVQELKTIETLKSDFISNVSHEFKTPLAVIQSYSKALRRKDLDDETRAKYEKVLDNNVYKLTSLTSNILNLSKIENQRIVIDKTEFLLDEQIRQAILLLEPEWKNKNITFELDLKEALYYGSKDLLAQVWQNLIGNAVKFSHPDSTIFISLYERDDSTVVKVRDEGIGMDDETQKHIFEKFYQGDTTHSVYGNGLGLSLVKRITDICGGEIIVESQKNVGSTFTVIL